MASKEEICSRFFDIQKWIPDFELCKEKRKALCFRETLTVELKDDLTKTSKPVGGYCILVDSLGPNNREFVIHVQSSMTIDGHFSGSKIISSAMENFHCLEEKRTEFFYKECGLYKKTIYLGLTGDAYYVKLTNACPCKKLSKTKDLNLCYTNGFLSEGVSLLLMRYLAIVNYEGTILFESVNIDGNIVKSQYVCYPIENLDIDGQMLNAYTIERTIYESDNTMFHIRTHLSSKGKIIRHNWLDEQYVLKINPFADPGDTDTNDRICVPLRDRWPQDIEMMSKYLDMKSKKVTEQTEYLEEHPEIKHLIADYVQTLLIVKPEDVIDFTIQHFKAFAKDPKTWETSALDKMYDDILKNQVWEKGTSACSVCGKQIDNSSAGICVNILTTNGMCPKCHIECDKEKGGDDFMLFNLNKYTYNESDNNLDTRSCPPDVSSSGWPVGELRDEEKINVMSILNQDSGDAPVETKKCRNRTIFIHEPRNYYLYHFLPGDVSL